MNTQQQPFIIFPPIGRHGIIGDRRTGALVAADGTLDWFCAPDFDSSPVFASLLDTGRGGFCRLGPDPARFGHQRYIDGTAILITAWPDLGIDLADAMAWPEDEQPGDVRGERTILRRLRCDSTATLHFELRPRKDFRAPSQRPHPVKNGALFPFSPGSLGLWASFPIYTEGDGAHAILELRPRDEHWIAIGWNTHPERWSVERAVNVFANTRAYWLDWSEGLEIKNAGSRAAALQRSAITVQLLSSAPHDSALAALTTSLPERIGGDRNYDYRCAWVRDASLSLAMLARMGKTGEVQHYLEWLCGLGSTTKCPLQVCYHFDGDPDLDEETITGVRGYCDSLPVRTGNRAAKQIQTGSLGYLADCIRIYFDEGGKWEDRFWQLLKRASSYVCDNWTKEDNGVWELPEKSHHVASRVMCWVVLERSASIARRTGHTAEGALWLEVADEIHAEVMDKGWCAEKNSFRQRYGSDALDASALLIPLMGFLPANHPRAIGTLEALESELVVHGLLHRFDPMATPGCKPLPIAEFEGAFLPSVFWHAHALAKIGRCDEAEAILSRCEAVAAGTGIYAEEIDAATDTFLGNVPLLFAHVEYVRAVMELNRVRGQGSQTPATSH